jgi:hypothetical protein
MDYWKLILSSLTRFAVSWKVFGVFNLWKKLKSMASPQEKILFLIESYTSENSNDWLFFK